MIVVDTGPIVALLSDRHDHHDRCKEFLAGHPGPLLVPSTVFTKVLTRRAARGVRAEIAFIADIQAGLFTLLESTSADLTRIAELVEAYADSRWAAWTPR